MCHPTKLSKEKYNFWNGERPNTLREKRAQIEALCAAGYSVRQIGCQLQCPKSTVHDPIRRYQQTGSHVDHPRSGQRIVSTAWNNAYMCQLACRQWKVTVMTLYVEWVPVIGRKLSIQMIWNQLVSGVINCNVPNYVCIQIYQCGWK